MTAETLVGQNTERQLPVLRGVSMKVSIRYFLDALKYWSERRDLNSGPLAPHASALPGCATLRHVSSSEDLNTAGLGSGPARGMIRPLRADALQPQRRRILISSSSSTR